MALKDWKKTRKYIINADFWVNIKNRNDLAIYNPKSTATHSDNYVVRVQKKFKVLDEKTFRLKTQAMKFAKSYMKKN